MDQTLISRIATRLPLIISRNIEHDTSVLVFALGHVLDSFEYIKVGYSYLLLKYVALDRFYFSSYVEDKLPNIKYNDVTIAEGEHALITRHFLVSLIVDGEEAWKHGSVQIDCNDLSYLLVYYTRMPFNYLYDSSLQHLCRPSILNSEGYHGAFIHCTEPKQCYDHFGDLMDYFVPTKYSVFHYSFDGVKMPIGLENVKIGKKKVSLPVIQDIAKFHLLGGSLVEPQFSKVFPPFSGVTYVVDVTQTWPHAPRCNREAASLPFKNYYGSLLADYASGSLHYQARDNCATHDKFSHASCYDNSVRDVQGMVSSVDFGEVLDHANNPFYHGDKELMVTGGEYTALPDELVVTKGIYKSLPVQCIRRSYRPDAQPRGAGVEYNFQLRHRNHRVRVRGAVHDVGIVDLDRVATIQLLNGGGVRNIHICVVWCPLIKVLLAFAFLDMNDNLHQRLIAEAIIPRRG